MAKQLKEIATGDIYPWSESWAKNPRFVEENDALAMTAAEPTVVVENDGGGTPAPEPEPETGGKQAKAAK